MISRNHGHIIAIASMASFISVPGIADYAATKAGLLSFHEALKEEIIQVHKAPKVLTTIIHPSWTMTALTAKDADLIEKTQGPLLTAATVADAIVKPLFSATGRQVIIPDKLTPLSTVKGWPNWMQDKFRGIVGRLSVGELLKK